MERFDVVNPFDWLVKWCKGNAFFWNGKFLSKKIVFLRRFKNELSCHKDCNPFSFSFRRLLFFPLAEFDSETNILVFNAFGFESKTPGGVVPLDIWYALPTLILTLTAVLLGGYLAMGLFRAVKLAQFQKLLKIAHIDIAVIAAWIAVFYGFVYYVIPLKLNDPSFETPLFRWTVFLPLVALLLTIAATSGLRKDIKKVRSTDRIR